MRGAPPRGDPCRRASKHRSLDCGDGASPHAEAAAAAMPPISALSTPSVRKVENTVTRLRLPPPPSDCDCTAEPGSPRPPGATAGAPWTASASSWPLLGPVTGGGLRGLRMRCHVRCNSITGDRGGGGARTGSSVCASTTTGPAAASKARLSMPRLRMSGTEARQDVGRPSAGRGPSLERPR